MCSQATHLTEIQAHNSLVNNNDRALINLTTMGNMPRRSMT